MNITPEHINDVFNKAKLIVTPQALQTSIDAIAIDMSKDLHDKNPILLTVMNGALFFAAELAKRLNFPLELDYCHATRYQGETAGGTVVHWIKQPSIDLAGRHVVVVDDILDGGITLKEVVHYCNAMGAKQTDTVVMLDKPAARLKDGLPEATYHGLEIPNDYVFGMGLDYHNYLRNVPGIYQVAPEHM
jgi:hypoxanthine phosphoribosyltransferase